MEEKENVSVGKSSNELKSIWGNIAALFKVKSLLTLVMTFVFAMLALRGSVDTKDVLSVFLMIVSFYFGTQSKKE